MNFNENIKIHCTDNDKWITAKVINQTDGWLSVLMQPGDIKVMLKKTKPGTYVGNMAGYEFVYQTKSN